MWIEGGYLRVWRVWEVAGGGGPIFHGTGVYGSLDSSLWIAGRWWWGLLSGRASYLHHIQSWDTLREAGGTVWCGGLKIYFGS